MTRDGLRDDSRGISPAVTQALTIGITAMVVTGLLIGGSQMVESQRERVTEQALQNVGDGVARDLLRLDAFDTQGLNSSVSFRATYPDRIADETYNVKVRANTNGARIYVNATGPDRFAVVRFQNETDVCQSFVSSGSLAVRYNASEHCLEVDRG